MTTCDKIIVTNCHQMSLFIVTFYILMEFVFCLSLLLIKNDKKKKHFFIVCVLSLQIADYESKVQFASCQQFSIYFHKKHRIVIKIFKIGN